MGEKLGVEKNFIADVMRDGFNNAEIKLEKTIGDGFEIKTGIDSFIVNDTNVASEQPVQKLLKFDDGSYVTVWSNQVESVSYQRYSSQGEKLGVEKTLRQTLESVSQVSLV